MYLFGCSGRRLTAEQCDLRERIAALHGAEFHYFGRYTVLAEEGTYRDWSGDDGDPTSWFSCPNLGDPFDRDVAASVEADLLEEGTT